MHWTVINLRIFYIRQLKITVPINVSWCNLRLNYSIYQLQCWEWDCPPVTSELLHPFHSIGQQSQSKWGDHRTPHKLFNHLPKLSPFIEVQLMTQFLSFFWWFLPRMPQDNLRNAPGLLQLLFFPILKQIWFNTEINFLHVYIWQQILLSICHCFSVNFYGFTLVFHTLNSLEVLPHFIQ